MRPKKLGTAQTIDIATGAVLETTRDAATLLPPGPDVCQVCAVDHAHDQPHNQQSLYYRMHFHADHGRWPTWSDAMHHCTPEVQAFWKKELIALMRSKGFPVPDDLLTGPAPGR